MEFLKSKEILFCFIIFACKVIEVSLSSIKTVFLVKGNRIKATVLAFLEALLWAFVISGVISDLNTNILWLLAYCFGYTAGYYVGSTLENKLAIGTIDVQFIFPEKYLGEVEHYLMENNFGYYFTSCIGKSGRQIKCDTILPRKGARNIRKQIEDICEHDIFTTNYDVSYVKGGYSTKKISK